MSNRTILRTLLAVLLWTAALVPVAFYFMDAAEPGSAVPVARSIGHWLVRGLWVGLGAAAFFLLVYPPFWPSVRLLFARLRSRMNVDQAPMIQAMSRLEHHETSDDHAAIARVLFHMGDPARAYPHAIRAVELDRDSLKARYLLARILEDAGQLPGALQQYQEIIRFDASHAFGEALLRLGLLQFTVGDYDNASVTLQRHHDTHGPNRRVLLARGKLAGKRGDANQRVELLREAARAPIDGEHMSPEDALARARARVALLRGSSA